MTRHLKCGKSIYGRHILGGDYLVSLFFCISLLSKVITDTINFELLTNICCAIYTIKNICHINVARVDET